MRLQLTVTHRGTSSAQPSGPSVVELEVDAPHGTRAAELAVALSDHLGLTDSGADHFDNGSALPALIAAGNLVDPDSLVGLPPLLDGASLVLGAPHPLQDNGARHRLPGRTAAMLAVTHGPDCGRFIDLRPGVLTVGRSTDADLCLDDPSLSRLHAEFRSDADGVTLRDLGSTNGTRVDGTLVGAEPVHVTTASRIDLGDSTMALRPAGAVPASTVAVGDGTLAVNRRPRIIEPPRPVTITLPTPPPPPRRTRVPWVAVLLPVPVAAALALVVGPTMLAFALMGPVLMVGTALSDRWGSSRTYAAELAAHEGRLRAAHERIDAACREEQRTLATLSPDPASVLAIATGPGERLWERRRGGDDALTVSVGRCLRDASLQLAGPPSDGSSDQPQLEGAPCTLSLSAVGVLGVCGVAAEVGAAVRSVVGQLVTLNSPMDLRLVALLADEQARERWAWLRRIPHCQNASRDVERPRATAFAVLSHDESDVHDLVGTLAVTIRGRMDNRRAEPWHGPSTVVLVDGAAAFRSVPDLAVVLADGPRVGIHCIVLGVDRRELPHETGAVLELPLDAPAVLSLPGHRHHDLVVDRVRSAWSERVSRSLAPLRDATPADGPSSLPATTGLRACSDLDDRGAPGVAEAWQHRPHSTTIPLGVCSTGTFSIDLATDGPHLLVGGTTGAGKSELLRTLVASLALQNSPQHLSFVLVDYKGGAAFRACAGLPHVAGVVTDLDDQLAARALTSLTAEVTRRERLFRDVGVTDFVAYQNSSHGPTAPLARLVVVVDEFRVLAEELPAFVDGLVHLAAIGRSLGIHLVLATQRPAGVVTADIKANVNLRIALRMRDRTDSDDVVDSPAAALLDPSTPGRAYARVGGAPLVEFQTAQVGSTVWQAEEGSLRVRTWTPSTPPEWPSEATTEERSELSAIVAATREATALAGLASAPAAWLPPLPDHVAHHSLPEPDGGFSVAVGLVDVPEQQRQESLVLDLRARGHWAVAGGPGSGRTTTLLTVAWSLCARRGPEELHVYAVSSGSLACLDSLPQVGASIDWSDRHRVERLLTRLAAEVADRRAALARHGHATMAQWWAADEEVAPPPLLLLVDDWDLVAGRHDDLALVGLVDRLLAVLREGEAVGMTAVLAGDRSLLLGRAGSAVSHRVVLRLADPSDAVLLGLLPRQVGALRRPGRGLTSDGHHVQLSLPPEASPRGATQTSDALGAPEALDTAGRPDTTGAERGPWRIDALPHLVHEDELAERLRGKSFETCTDTLALGVGGDDSAVLGLDPGQDGRRWLVAGAAGAGVSTTLLLIGRALLTRGTPLAVVAPRSGPLDVLRADPELLAWCDGVDTAGLVEARRRYPSLAVIVDSADELLDAAVESVVREVGNLVERDGGLLLVGANATALSSMYRGIALEVARHRTGILLGPRTTLEGEVFGGRLPADRDARPGRGHLVRRGVAIPLQIALPSTRLPRSLAPEPRGNVTA